MNNRLQELANEAELYVDLYGKPYPRAMSAEEADAAYKKFAELIVQECIEVVKWTPSQFPNDECVKNIKKHFGVEQ